MPWGTPKKGKSLLCLPDQLLTSPNLYIRRVVARSENLGGHIVMHECCPLVCRVPWHPHADFGRSVNPISTKGGRLFPPNNTGTPGFLDLPMAM